MANESVDNFFKGTAGRDNTLVVGGSMETATRQNLKTKFISFPIADVSTAGSQFFALGIAGSIVKITASIDAVIVTANAVLKFEISGTPVLGADLTILFGDTNPGTAFQSTPDEPVPPAAATNVVTATGLTGTIEVITVGASVNVSAGVIIFEILPS